MIRLPLERRKALEAKAYKFAGQLDEVTPYLEGRGISRELADMFKFGFVAGSGEFTGRLSIPYLTANGVIGIKYRCVNVSHGEHKDTDCPKYLWEAGLGTHLYNAQVLKHASDLVILTEGELDAACAQGYTGIPSVGYPGAKSWEGQPHYRLCFESVNEVAVIADGDKVGRTAARKVAESIGAHARVVDMPDGSDSNAFIISQGVAAFVEKVTA